MKAITAENENSQREYKIHLSIPPNNVQSHLTISSLHFNITNGCNDIARDRKIYVGCRGNRYIRSKYKRKTPIETEETMSDVAEAVIPGVHCNS